MILTDYYRMAKLPNCKSKHRFDCVASTGSYEPFEDRARRSRENRFKFYCSPATHKFSGRRHRKAEYAITDTTNISSIYTPDLDNPLLGYGDVVGTNDALLFHFSADYRQLEVFVARGLKNNEFGLYTLFTDGELVEEIEQLRQQAKPTDALNPETRQGSSEPLPNQ